MSDTDNMERKYARQQYASPKCGTDSKKDVATTGQKRWAKRRDGPQCYDQSISARRPLPQKPKYVDKRPRSRGVSNGSGSDQVTGVEDAGPEYGSVQSWGSKKGNASHLLNFHFEPRDMYGRGAGGFHGHGGRQHGNYRGRGRVYRSHGKTYNKEHFLQANCQFVVKEGSNYAGHLADPDSLVDWDLIEQVRIYNNNVPSCPICLYAPTAAKITRCGHIYCAGCMLHYLSLGEKKWRRCPICYDAVQQSDLKSVICLETPTHTVDQEITMKLMKRRRGMTQALPMDQWCDQEGQLYNMEGSSVDTRYMKLLAVTPDQVLAMVDSEKQTLMEQLNREDTDSLESSYIQAALDLLDKRRADITIRQIVSDDLKEALGGQTASDEGEDVSSHSASPQHKPINRSVVYSSAFSEDEDESVPTDVSQGESEPVMEDPRDAADSTEVSRQSDTEETESVLPLGASGGEDSSITLPEGDSVSTDTSFVSKSDEKTRGHRSDVEREDHFYYFYQACDGQHIYPNSINARCLVKEYGNLEKSPPTITARIVELEDFTMTEDLRHRLRYLSHLPVTCEFQVAELALKPPLVSRETLQLFSVDIDRKKKLRQRKSREERKQSRRIQEMENKELGIDPTALIVWSEAPASHIVHSASAPVLGDVTMQDAGVTGRDMKRCDIGATVSGSNVSVPVPRETGVDDNSHDKYSPSGSVGTDVLATSPTSIGSSDDSGQTSSLSFAQMLRAGKAKAQDVWPKSLVTPATVEPRPRRASGSGSDEDRVPVPTYKASFGDAIQQALDKYKSPGEEDKATLPVAAPGKKKKKQKTLLFATTMNRAK